MYLLRGRQQVDNLFLDFNLLPPGHRPRALPMLGIALGLLAAIGVMLLLAIFQFKADADADVARIQDNLQQAERRLAELSPTAPPVDGGQDAGLLAKYRIGWSRVLQTIVASAPGDVRLQDVSFAAEPAGGPQAIVKGEAAEYAAVVEFADNLRSSPFFARVSVQSMGETAPVTPTATTGPAASIPGAPSPTVALPAIPTATRIPPTPQIVQPPATPTAIPPRTPPAGPSPSVGPPLVIIPPAGSPGTATSTPVPGLPGQPTSTPTASATPTGGPPASGYSFIVTGKDQTCDLGAPANFSGDLVTGRVLDVDGRAMPDIRVRVTSINTADPWSAETSTDVEGGFRFYLTKGNFKAEVVSGSSEVANELWTRSAQETGVCWWHVTFKKNTSGTPVAGEVPPGVPTSTPTSAGTATPTPTITPTPPAGTKVFGTPTASDNLAEAGLAIDNNPETMWNAGRGPWAYWQETFGTAQYVSGISMFVAQTPNGNTTHVVRFLDSTGAEIPNATITFSGVTGDGQVLQRTFPTPIPDVVTVKIETQAGPSNVAWREVWVYAAGAPTPTPTPTSTPRSAAGADFVVPGEPPEVRVFYAPPNDVDWIWFTTAYTTTPTPYIMYSIRVTGSVGTDPEMTLYTNGGSTAITNADNSCGGTDPLIAWPLTPASAYYVKIRNRTTITGTNTLTYSIAVRRGEMACDGTITSLSPLLQPLAYSPAGNGDRDTAPWPDTTASMVADMPARGPGLAAPVSQPLSGVPAGGRGAPARQPVAFTIVLDVKSGEGP